MLIKLRKDWMMFWLSKHSTWSRTRDFEVTTRQWGLSQTFSLVPGEDDDDHDDVNNKRKLTYLPSVSISSSIWYKGHWMSVSREQVRDKVWYRTEERLKIRLVIFVLPKPYDLMPISAAASWPDRTTSSMSFFSTP